MLGFVIPVPQKYEKSAIKCIKRLRTKFQLANPIEIWEAGSEISTEAKIKLEKLGNIQFRNVSEFPEDLNHWKGFQIKAFAAYHTSFDEFIVCDSDIVFCQNPLIILDDPQYLKTGCFFFRDLKWKYSSNNSQNYMNRKKWIHSLLPSPSAFFPKEWMHLYNDEPASTKKSTHLFEAYMEAGVMYFNRSKLQKALEIAYKLNDDHEKTYKYIHGDKETWWLACCMTNTEFGMNKKIPIYMPPLTHFYAGRPFFFQKQIKIHETLLYWLKTPFRILKNKKKELYY